MVTTWLATIVPGTSGHRRLRNPRTNSRANQTAQKPEVSVTASAIARRITRRPDSRLSQGIVDAMLCPHHTQEPTCAPLSLLSC